MENKCGCWAVLRRGVRGSCNSSDTKNSANSIPRTSLVYDAGMKIFYSHGCLFPFSFFFNPCLLRLQNRTEEF